MKIFVANRAEIACRIIKSARALGVPTCVSYCREDADLPFVREADESVLTEGENPRSSYLDMDVVMAAVKKTGATHVHPGYGFLSENPDFVERLDKEGVGFIGPRAESILALGDKQKSKRLLRDLDIPIIDSYEGEDQSDEAFEKALLKIGFPALLKPSAGGGGKGMFRLDSKEALQDALSSARRVARSSFGDDRLLLERYLEKARHVEVQVFGDGEGSVHVLGERECSIQRRHQKLIEESPCVDLPAAIRERLHRESKKLAEHLKYRSAGTLEWLWDGAEGIYFLEMNTRLQVEHPVTEMVFGVDLVRWQMELALHGKFPEKVPTQKGHSIEVRMVAEDPQMDFMPSGGKIHRLRLPDEDARWDFGYYEKNLIGGSFDSLLGKLIVWAENREEAISKIVKVLEKTQILGPQTNRAYLIQILSSNAFRRGQISTQFLASFPPLFDVSAGLAWLGKSEEQEAENFLSDESEDLDYFSPWGFVATQTNTNPWWEDFEGKRYFSLPFADWSERLESQKDLASGRSLEDAFEARIISPMPAKVVQIFCEEGQSLKKGDSLLILEAMKMEHHLRAKSSCRVNRINVKQGEQVPPEALLIELEKEPA